MYDRQTDRQTENEYKGLLVAGFGGGGRSLGTESNLGPLSLACGTESCYHTSLEKDL